MEILCVITFIQQLNVLVYVILDNVKLDSCLDWNQAVASYRQDVEQRWSLQF